MLKVTTLLLLSLLSLQAEFFSNTGYICSTKDGSLLVMSTGETSISLQMKDRKVELHIGYGNRFYGDTMVASLYDQGVIKIQKYDSSIAQIKGPWSIEIKCIEAG